MPVDLGLDHLIDEVKSLPLNSIRFAANCISLFEAAFLSTRNPFGENALGVPATPIDELMLAAQGNLSFTEGTSATHILPAATGGSGNYTYTLTDSDDSPFSVPGLGFTAATRTINGTPSTPGTYMVKYTVNDGTTTLERVFNIVVTDTGTALTLPPLEPVDQNLTLAEAFSETLPRAMGGTGNYTYSLGGSIPPGLDFDAATRVLSGIPTSSGTYSMTYMVSDGVNTVSRIFTYEVAAPEGPTTGSFSATDTSADKQGNELALEVAFSAFNLPANWFTGTVPGPTEDVDIYINQILEEPNQAALNIEIDGLSEDNHFIAEIESNLFITLSSPSATDVTLRGPTHSTSILTDTTEPYFWIPEATAAAALLAFFNDLDDGDSMTVTFRYDG